MKLAACTIAALILALIYSTIAQCYWIRQYYGKNPFLIHMEVKCK
jgi:hypothetical protein